MFGLHAGHIIYYSSGRLQQNWLTGGDAAVNRIGVRGVLNGLVERHPPLGINLFTDKFLLHELILSGTERVLPPS